MPHISEQMLRSLKRPFRVGDQVRLREMTVTIDELLPDGRPAEARFPFDHPLEDAQYYFAEWRGRGYVPWTPPAVGATVTLAPVQFLEAIFAK
jgi:hypothetical protein